MARSYSRAVLFALTLLAALAAIAPATSLAGQRIVGGQAADPAEYPYQAGVWLYFPDGPDNGTAEDVALCGGSLIASRWVVTAAHCLGGPPVHARVVLGTNALPSPFDPATGNTFEVITMPSHESFNGSGPGGFDVALLELDRAADIGGQPLEQLRLPRPADTALWQGGSTATTVGWGLTEDQADGGDLSLGSLQEVQIPIFTDAQCDGVFTGSGLFNAGTMVCAGGTNGKDSCSGDSGGPLLVPDGSREALAGVVSFGVGPDADRTCAEGAPGVYSRVAADPLNVWVRDRVPQAEIDVSVPQPEPGQSVTLTSAARYPGGAYDSLAWDLDGDGQYDDATGGSASAAFATRGTFTVGLKATKGTESEIRRIDLSTRFRSPTGFTAPTVSVQEGQPIAVTVAKQGGGAGSVLATILNGSAQTGVDFGTLTPPTLAFADAQPTQTFTIPTIDDKRDEPDETLRITLGSFTGELLPGAPGTLDVTILDNDVAAAMKLTVPKRLKFKRGKAKVTVDVTVPGTVALRILDGSSRTLAASGKRKLTKPGRATFTLKLGARGKRALKRKRSAKGRLTANYTPTDGSGDITLRRSVTLRR